MAPQNIESSIGRRGAGVRGCVLVVGQSCSAHVTEELCHLSQIAEQQPTGQILKRHFFVWLAVLSYSCQRLKIEIFSIKSQLSGLVWHLPSWYLPAKPEEQFPQTSPLVFCK